MDAPKKEKKERTVKSGKELVSARVANVLQKLETLGTMKSKEVTAEDRDKIVGAIKVSVQKVLDHLDVLVKTKGEKPKRKKVEFKL